MNIVLVEPEIPPNTGNVARLCAATGSVLHLVEPLGFSMDDRQMQRAGMDYWKQVTWHRWSDWDAFMGSVPEGARLWLVEQGGASSYADVAYRLDDYLVFGRETSGLPRGLLERHRDTSVHLPMPNPEARSLNLSNCVAIVLYEALRQLRFPTR